MEIYVRSRGTSRSHEYEWINQSQQKDEPSIINRSFSIKSNLTNESNANESNEFRITKLHGLEQPAIIVLREGLDLLLLLTGIKAGWNAPGGAVYHSVAWLSREEKVIRALAIHALQAELQHTVISAITTLDSKLGFQVDFGKLKQFDFDKSLSLEEQSKSFEIGKLAKNTLEFRHELANELTNICLPEEGTFLIVVSDVVSEAFLKNVDVWRGLTNNLKQQNWVEFHLKKNSLPIHLVSPPIAQPIQEEAIMQPSPVWKSTQKSERTKIVVWGLGLLVIGILIGLMISFAFLGAKIPSIPMNQPSQENQTLNLSNQEPRKTLPSPEDQVSTNQQILQPPYQSHQLEQSQPILQEDNLSVQELMNQ